MSQWPIELREHVDRRIAELRVNVSVTPIPMRLHCPACFWLHVDRGEHATRPHKTHACQHCGHVWTPAMVPTVGVQFLPGCKDEVARTDRDLRECLITFAHDLANAPFDMSDLDHVNETIARFKNGVAEGLLRALGEKP